MTGQGPLGPNRITSVYSGACVELAKGYDRVGRRLTQ